MVAQIELYRGPERTLVTRLPFMEIVRGSMEQILGRSLGRARLRVVLLSVPDQAVVAGSPLVEHLIQEFGYMNVKVYEGGSLVYQHPHPVSDIITQSLQNILRNRFPEETEWTFRIDVPGMPLNSDEIAAPKVEGEVLVRSYGPGEGPGFTIRRLTEEEPPVRRLHDFFPEADDNTGSCPVRVLLPESLHCDLHSGRRLSYDVEEGGFLTGLVYRDGNQEGAYLVEVTAAVPAKYTGASFLHFTFTGDSFAGIKRTLMQQRPGERLLGWYHTHLFPATDNFGLSSVDVSLHFSTFTIPWQIAGLINISGSERTLRFYVPDGKRMVLCPSLVMNERHRNSSIGY
jgi:JAB N-terminal domain